jgi:hypothetical protein
MRIFIENSSPWAFNFHNGSVTESMVEVETGGISCSGATWTDASCAWRNGSHNATFEEVTWTGGFSPQHVQFHAVQNALPAYFDKSRLSHHTTAIVVEGNALRLKCTVFDRLQAAVHAVGQAPVLLQGSFGGRNEFRQNRVHFRLTDAPIPEVMDGGNLFMAPEDWVMFGTTSDAACMAAGAYPWAEVDGNQGFVSMAGLPAWIPLVDLSSSHPTCGGSPVGLLDDAPVLYAGCDVNNPSPHEHELRSSESSWRLYPNPSTGKTSLRMGSAGLDGSEGAAALFIEISDALGRPVLEMDARPGGLAEWEMNGLSGGCYFLSVRDEAGKVVHRDRFVYSP